MRFTTALALAATAVGTALAQNPVVLGFNSGATDDTGKAKMQSDFETEFKAAKSMQGAPGNFSAIRLYSNIQAYTNNTPIAAFPAAISTGTQLLLGIWASGTDNIDNELSALESAIKQYGSKLTDLVIGISVGSEDLYRVSEPGIKNNAGPGQSADVIVNFIKTTRQRLAGTALSNIKVTHVDTWTAWVNGSNKAVIDNIDFVAVNAFPFYENDSNNTIDNAPLLLAKALNATDSVAGGKDVWITETGWAYTGPNFGAAQATVDNLSTYWKNVGCAIFGKRNVFWYTLKDSNPDNQVKFAITNNLSTQARFDLSCPAGKTLPSLDGTSSNSTSSSSGSTTTSSPTTKPSSNGNSANTKGSGAGAMASVSLVNTMVMVVSVFAAATWAL